MHAATAFVISHVSAWLTLRHGIVTLSILAGGVNITGIVPQLRTMLAARSSRGQSPLGWTLAATCSGSLLFVNSVGYHAYVLATGNLLSMSGCLTAALLARHLRDDGAVPAEALEALRDAPAELVSELAAPTLNSLTESVLEEHHRRTGEAIPGEVVSELRTVELQASPERCSKSTIAGPARPSPRRRSPRCPPTSFRRSPRWSSRSSIGAPGAPGRRSRSE